MFFFCIFSGRSYTPTHSWWYSFRRRHPEIAVRTPSLIDAGRAKMSNSYVIEGFIETARGFLSEHQLLNQADRIFNIDESWFSPTEEKRQKVVVMRTQKTSYRTITGISEHVTMAMGASASGKWLPPFFIFKGSIPASDNSFLTTGPDHALYAATESGHIDSQTYFDYIRHIEPYLGEQRPIVIVQDNLGAHEQFELVQFCAQKGIHLLNMPTKTSHILQPMDKLFGPLKTRFNYHRRKGHYVQQRALSKSKVPVLTKYAMNDISAQTIRDAFAITGICPLSFDAIPKGALVSDKQTANNDETNNNETSDTTTSTSLDMAVDCVETDNNTSFDIQLSDTYANASVQTDPIKSLPCSVCFRNDVSLHPAVQSGMVDIEFAAALIPDE